MAIIYQISLNGEAFDARNMTWGEIILQSGCKPDRAWKDPIAVRSILKGEFGCSVSHMRVWQKIADSGQNGIVFEEDAIFPAVDVSEINRLLDETYDSVWLGWRENKFGYWYNAHAYAITPETARFLLDGFDQQIIPVDEWMPKRLEGKNNYFFDPPIVSQIPRSIRPSTIEIEEPTVVEQDIDFHIVTVATEPERMVVLERSADHFDTSVVNLGIGSSWRDAMDGFGGMPKIKMMRDYLDTLPDDSIVMFMDGYDTFFADSPLVILERFLGFGVDILFGAESNLWPRPEMAEFWPTTLTKNKYLNSGLYIGKVGPLKAFFDMPATDHYDDDQAFLQERYLANVSSRIAKKYGVELGSLNVALDSECYIFQNNDPNVFVQDGQIWNLETGCCGCVYHGNGDLEAKAHFAKLSRAFGFSSSIVYNPSDIYSYAAPEIIKTELFPVTECKRIIEIAEKHGGWQSMEGDKFPAQEIRVRELGLWDFFEEIWEIKLSKIMEDYWPPVQHLGLRDAFILKYSMDTQTELGLHTDASLVTASIKLNDDYEGGELIFPRQNYSNFNDKVGQCLLFPSAVTHGHRVAPLLSGVKYSLTMWTSRYAGDVNG